MLHSLPRPDTARRVLMAFSSDRKISRPGVDASSTEQWRVSLTGGHGNSHGRTVLFTIARTVVGES